MTANPEITIERKIPRRKDSLIFRGKTTLLQIKRRIADLTYTRVERHAKGSRLSNAPIVATSQTPLWTESGPDERFLLAGKIHNLRLVVKKLDGLEIPAGKIFSFWKQVGRAGPSKGFVVGRELREGCIIPNVGGGLCQISNALYDAALQAGLEIVERHAHTQVIPGSLAEKGRDATVFWNYVDLRFRCDKPFCIEAKLDAENLTVQFRGEKSAGKAVRQIQRAIVHGDAPNSCASCEVGDCHRVVDPKKHANFGRTAYLLDEFSPEFDKHIKDIRTNDDQLLIPLDGRRFRKANYAWTTRGFDEVHQSVFVTAKRSYRSRKLSAQGAARQLNLLTMYEELADSYARRLTYDVLHVVVQHNLLPFLWKSGCLGGRTFDVLMTALPMTEIQKRLDFAYSLHPESKTLGDFRADSNLVTAEQEALRNARRIITPHTEIASLFSRRADLIDWQMPETARLSRPNNDKPVIVFPASTVGRRGCYELREALRGLDVKVILLGPLIEGADFWNGFDTERGVENWLLIADLVVLPAFVEHKPRRLLLVAAAGVHVIASKACGVSNVPDVETIDADDVKSLRKAIINRIGRAMGRSADEL